MLCPRCYGKHVVTVNGAVVPCPECGGMGELHCCDSLQEQPGCEVVEEGTNHRGGSRAAGGEAQRKQKNGEKK